LTEKHTVNALQRLIGSAHPIWG